MDAEPIWLVSGADRSGIRDRYFLDGSYAGGGATSAAQPTRQVHWIGVAPAPGTYFTVTLALCLNGSIFITQPPSQGSPVGSAGGSLCLPAKMCPAAAYKSDSYTEAPLP